MDKFTQAYIECALWASTVDDPRYPAGQDNPGGEPMDNHYSADDLAPQTIGRMMSDCAEFQERAGSLMAESSLATHPAFPAEERAGHDFWLTRNGHGAGFWDGDWREPAATELTKLAHSFGECDLYVGDDGLIYAS